MSGVKMHRRGLGKAVTLGAVALLGLVLSAQTASAALLTLDDVTLPGDPIVIVNGVNDTDTAAGPPPATEGVANAIDNTTNKYLNFLDYGSGFIVTPSQGISNVKAIRLYSANDAPARDPASFIIEGAASPNGPFTLIYGQNVQLGARNPAGQPINPNTQNFVDVSFPNTANYATYRVTFPTLSNAGSDVGMQIAEVELLGTIIPEPTTLGILGLGALGLLRRRRA
jgi:PEP-CTERM motif